MAKHGLSALAVVLLALAMASGYRDDGEDRQAHQRQVESRGPLRANETHLVELFETVAPSVVNIRSTRLVQGFFSRNVSRVPAGTGTGFLWDDQGHVVTNFHVVQYATGGVQVSFNDGVSRKAEVIGVSRHKDLAVLRVENPPEEVPVIPLGSSKELRVGQSVYAIGNPFGLDQSLSSGIISAVGREIESRLRTTIHDVIQTDAAINPGNSGGPLIDSAGGLIGVNTAIYSPSGGSAGISFAIPVDTVRRTVPDLITSGQVLRPILGFVPYTGPGSRRFPGVVIVEVEGPLAEAGAEGAKGDAVRDIIVSVDGRPTPNLEELQAILENYRPGDRVEVGLLRGEEQRQVETVLQPPPE